MIEAHGTSYHGLVGFLVPKAVSDVSSTATGDLHRVAFGILLLRFIHPFLQPFGQQRVGAVFWHLEASQPPQRLKLAESVHGQHHIMAA
jgi:hypothetical protein